VAAPCPFIAAGALGVGGPWSGSPLPLHSHGPLELQPVPWSGRGPGKLRAFGVAAGALEWAPLVLT
jgi:hypothetical protein